LTKRKCYDYGVNENDGYKYVISAFVIICSERLKQKAHVEAIIRPEDMEQSYQIKPNFKVC
jgi:hypothetical protein